MAKILVKDLKKLQEQFNPLTGRPRPRPQSVFFFCVICREFKQGSAKASIEIGGWCCTHHQRAEIAENGFREVQAAMKRVDDVLKENLDDGAEFVMPAGDVEAIIGAISVMIASDALPGVKGMLIKAREELHRLMRGVGDA